MEFKKVIISRTDSIGDVILTLPLAGMVKEYYPEAIVVFLGQAYTRPVIEACSHVDEFIDWSGLKDLPEEEAVDALKEVRADLIINVFPRKEIARLARRARIPYRMGTASRIYHWTTCNRLVRLSRKRSPLHELQLNLKLAHFLFPEADPSIFNVPLVNSPLAIFNPQWYNYGLEPEEPLPGKLRSLADKSRFNLILHPRSKGSAREWDLERYSQLVSILPEDRFRIFITGTGIEGEMIRGAGFFEKHPSVTDLTGQMSLAELIGFINLADGLVAASTGPLHLAAALGKVAIGIYPPIRPMHPGRWAPVGPEASFLVVDKSCSKCRRSSECQCMSDIEPGLVKSRLMPYTDNNPI